jgi:transposase-like protein
MDNLSLKAFYQKFPNEETCLIYLEQARWPQGRACPHCGSIKTYKFKNGKLFKCGECKKQFTAKVGTIFTDSHIKLQDWFLAVQLLVSHKKGVSSVYLSEQLGITQKTAWFMLQRIRHAMSYGSFDKPLGGMLEAGETYIGGKSKFETKYDNKMVVMGIVEKQKHGGRIVLKVTKHANATVALPFIRATANKTASVQTDESKIYYRLNREYPHESVNRSENEYVRDDVTTNTIERAWNYLKLSLKATCMNRVTPKHLSMYCDEFNCRYNIRDADTAQKFEEWFNRINSKHLPYKSLIS